MISGMLKEGEKITSTKGETYKVGKMLGSGGQGEVYYVDSSEGPKALKWYYNQTTSAEQKNTIMNLVEDGSPSPNFLWPEDFLIKEDETFGYIMALRPKDYNNIPDLLNRKTEPTFEKLILAVFNMVSEYEKLHKAGYSYKDISDQNVFFNPETGDVLICDNDNVSENGSDDSGVYGTMRFMAPEIVRGQAMPSRYTDLYSLAVLIFMMLLIGHPLDGKNEAGVQSLDDSACKEIYGNHPVFIYDPLNPENRPVPGIHDNPIIYWDRVYPQFLKDKFVLAFTKGLHNPAERILEKQWKDTAIKLIDSIILCPKCGAEVFYDEMKESNGQNNICWSCGIAIKNPPRIKIGKHEVLLHLKSKITSHHINGDYNLNKVIATVSQNPNNPSLWGLKNETQKTWTYVMPNGEQKELPPGKSAALIKGAKIDFGNIIGEI